MTLLRKTALALLASSAPVLAASGSPDLASARPKSVLIVHAQEPHLPWVAAITSGIHAALDAAPSSERPDVYTEHLDLVRFSGREAARAAWLIEKYRGVPIDLIIPVTKDALDVVLPLRRELWTRVPIVLCENERLMRGAALPDGITGVLAGFEIGKTLDLAKALFPDTRRVAFVNGAAASERPDTETFRHDLALRGDGLELLDLTGLPMAELQKRVATLPEQTIVFYWGIAQDGAGQNFIPREALRMFAPRSNRPIFGVAATMMGFGLIGGRVLDFEAVGSATGRMALRVLGGEPAASIPPVRGSFSRLVFDNRQLQRFGVAASRVPAGSEVLFRQTPFWVRYPRSTAAAVVVLLLQGGLIAALLIERRRLREAQALTMASLAAVPSAVVAIDSRGRIVQVNARWSALGLDEGAYAGVEAGGDFLGACRRAALAGEESDSRLLELIESVQSGRLNRGSIEYVRRGSDGDRWFETHVQALGRTGHGAVIAYRDVTRRHRADAEALQRRDEIAHLNRVAAMGELASSLAHELNQPLTAIVANAQAARRMLRSDSADAAELPEILNDIIEDDQRASDIIRRMRSFVRKEGLHRADIQLNEIVRGVIRLVASDASLRRTSLVLDLAPELPAVSGDSVQLQQVVLNLVLNGLDAVAERPAAKRRVEICTSAVDGHVSLSVRDSGLGIPDGDLSRLFEPFFTTKPQGLGMGLSICRTIVEAHAGRIQAETRLQGGAEFLCVFPAAGGASA